MGIDFFVLTRRILPESFHIFELIDQPLDLIHQKNNHELRVSSNHEVDSIPMHQCLYLVMLLGGDVKLSIHDRKN